MSSVPTNAEKIRRLPWTVAANAGNVVFCQLTVFGSVFMLFLHELGLKFSQMGFTLSLIPFCGLLALFVAPLTARFGFKRSVILSYSSRKAVMAFLLLTPWVLSRFGGDAAFRWVAGIVLVFAICRAVAETAWNPWAKEIVPDSIRGKFSAVNYLVMGLTGIAAVIGAGYVVGHGAGLGRFMGLIAVAVLFGVLSAVCLWFVPGGVSPGGDHRQSAHFRKMIRALKDRNFLLYLGGFGLVTLGVTGLVPYLAIFVKDKVGLAEGTVIYLQSGGLVGGLVSCCLWGWAADRFGSKPVMLSGLNVMVWLPLCWWLMPRDSDWSGPTALMLAALWGAVAYGWQMGASRYLFVTLVPHEKRTEYMAVFYAWMGLLGGAGPLLAGRALDYFKGIRRSFFVFQIDEFTPLFAAASVLLLGGVLILNWLRPRRGLGVTKFAAMFVRGNPVLAIESMVRYNLARDEGARVSMTERLGRARSPLNIDELIEALSDPSFNVRYEAVVTIARTRPDECLTDALLDILHADEPDLSIAAASALARIGDPRAIPALREALSSGYPLLEARSARALATLGDAEVIPTLLERFRKEPSEGQRIAYASALGALRCARAVPDLLHCLRDLENQSSRMELALALARTVGHEQYFMRLSRDMRSEPGTPAAQAMGALRKRMARLGIHAGEARRLAGECEEALARDTMDRAAELLVKAIRAFPTADLDVALAAILDECADRLAESGAERIEYVQLALHTLSAALDRVRDAPPPR